MPVNLETWADGVAESARQALTQVPPMFQGYVKPHAKLVIELTELVQQMAADIEELKEALAIQI